LCKAICNGKQFLSPLADALTQAEAAINRALDRLRHVCTGSSRRVDPTIIGASLQEVQLAERNLNLVSLLLPPVAQRDLLLAPDQAVFSALQGSFFRSLLTLAAIHGCAA
jgi:hypothetical protein